ncbi:DUF4148 domain-containing protein [Paraburkholderia panacisoli]|uniref:DUF4148 domain-containing protein n=1 Tax=Paraburkholderia panacisoli TaxID=2603818 RepID=A0A5B0G2E1_9BURK|nr:DUF4148 domain-containing protein [Paraburkholderia panacisoli]KAA0996099.1 DUF4148 domain-containing protein [Paraburkholderia panacisoli]
MRSLIQAAVVATALSAPALSFAQSNAPVTRAQVRAELIELERAGYHVENDHIHYPRAIQAAEARVAAEHATASGYGGVESGASLSGTSASVPAQAQARSLYFGH